MVSLPDGFGLSFFLLAGHLTWSVLCSAAGTMAAMAAGDSDRIPQSSAGADGESAKEQVVVKVMTNPSLPTCLRAST